MAVYDYVMGAAYLPPGASSRRQLGARKHSILVGPFFGWEKICIRNFDIK
jgi:hypothetical protein